MSFKAAAHWKLWNLAGTWSGSTTLKYHYHWYNIATNTKSRLTSFSCKDKKKNFVCAGLRAANIEFKININSFNVKIKKVTNQDVKPKTILGGGGGIWYLSSMAKYSNPPLIGFLIGRGCIQGKELLCGRVHY